MHRFYADESRIAEGIACLTPEDARHALRVLRMSEGQTAELFLNGRRFLGEISRIDGEDVSLLLREELPSTEARLRVTLYQGLPKADKMELIIQKAVELGAESIVPVAMERCVVRLDERDGRKKQERWQKIAREACKQSGRCLMPTVEAPLPFRALPERLRAHGAAIVPWEDAKGFSLRGFHQEHPSIQNLAVVIGPEGGIAPEEVAAMQEAGCRAVTLGPRILRTETAGLAAISALMCLYGEME